MTPVEYREERMPVLPKRPGRQETQGDGLMEDIETCDHCGFELPAGDEGDSEIFTLCYGCWQFESEFEGEDY